MLLLVAFGHEALISVGRGSRIDFVVPGILALAVMSTAFTSQAIGTGFERRYGVLKRLGASPLSRQGLIAAKTVTVLAVELGQAAIVLAVGASLGWTSGRQRRPPQRGCCCCCWPARPRSADWRCCWPERCGRRQRWPPLTCIYLVMLGLGGVLFPLTKFPPAAQPVLKLLPAGALSDGLRSVLAHAGGFPARDLLVLCAWAVAAIALAARTFRWE